MGQSEWSQRVVQAIVWDVNLGKSGFSWENTKDLTMAKYYKFSNAFLAEIVYRSEKSSYDSEKIFGDSTKRGLLPKFFVGQCDQYFLRYLTLKFENPKKTPFFALFGPFLAGNLW